MPLQVILLELEDQPLLRDVDDQTLEEPAPLPPVCQQLRLEQVILPRTLERQATPEEQRMLLQAILLTKVERRLALEEQPVRTATEQRMMLPLRPMPLQATQLE